MKYIIILGDGMAGEPLECIGGKTTLEQALTPEMDRLAKMSEIGLVSMVPEGMAPGSDTAKALSIGVGMEEDDVSFRCNLVTLTEDASLPYEDQRIVDHSSDEINTRDAGVLLEVLKEEVLKPGFELYRGTSYRHLLLWKNGHEMELTPPHDILTNQIREYLPGDPMLLAMMKESYRVLKEHPVNLKRKAQGLRPANSAWFWGAGKRPKLPDFQEKTGKRGVMISAVDLLKGIAAGSGMKIVHVEGADGGLHTNYEGKAQSAVRALLDEGYDFAYIHVEAPDEMGHQGSVEKKVRAIEFLDQRLIRIVREAMDASGEPYRLLILPDHPTPIAARTHTADPVPYLLYDRKRPENGAESYCERTAVQSGRWEKNGYHLIEHLFEY